MADKVITLDNVSLNTNDIVIINTADWTITKNGANYVHKADSTSEFFKLENGDNDIEITGTGTIDLTIDFKNRWA